MTRPVGTVAVLGTGHMGGAMAGTLRRNGFDVVVWNRTRVRAESVAAEADVRVAANPGEAVAEADVVVSSLADDPAVLEAYTGADGAAAGMRTGTVALETSTIAPETVRTVAPVVAEGGGVLLDAPVSGSVAFAQQGQLTFMVGGDERTAEPARPVLDALGAKVLFLGGLGNGAVAKLAVNALVHAIDVGLSEALVLAERAGVERSAIYDVFAGGAAAAPFVLYKRAAFEHPEGSSTAFSLDLMAKDLDLILQLAEAVGAPMAQAGLNRETVHRALAAGFSGRDMSAVAEYLRTRAG
ncbi:MAG: NAD(P)-dependent oxidoreductase [Candidatus Velamenicoccus archaeovorus]